MRGTLLVLLMLCLVMLLVVTGCHAHDLDGQATLHAHCTLCDLGLAMVAVVALLLALLGRVRTVAVRLQQPRVAERDAWSRWLLIRPPPVPLFA